jgi:hypothetical protein
MKERGFNCRDCLKQRALAARAVRRGKSSIACSAWRLGCPEDRTAQPHNFRPGFAAGHEPQYFMPKQTVELSARSFLAVENKQTAETFVLIFHHPADKVPIARPCACNDCPLDLRWS